MISIATELFLLATFLGMLILICFIRAIFGPTAPDRLVAFDTINTQVVAAMVVLGAAFGEIIFIDVAIIYAMLSFVSTLYLAKYLEANA